MHARALMREELIIFKFIWKNRKKKCLKTFKKNNKGMLILPDSGGNYKAKIIVVELH